MVWLAVVIGVLLFLGITEVEKRRDRSIRRLQEQINNINARLNKLEEVPL